MRPLLVLACALAFAACGGDDTERTSSSTSEREAAAPPDATRLQVEVTGTGPEPTEMQLVCAGRCDIEPLRSVVAAVARKERACTLQYGGPEQAHVTGTVEGKTVDFTVDRADGCGIADYEALFRAFGREPPIAG